MSENINLALKVWRQNGPDDKGHLETYEAKDISTDMSFLEMLDVVNEQLTVTEKNPLLLIMIAARVFVVCVEQWLTVWLTVQSLRPHFASSI